MEHDREADINILIILMRYDCNKLQHKYPLFGYEYKKKITEKLMSYINHKQIEIGFQLYQYLLSKIF